LVCGLHRRPELRLQPRRPDLGVDHRGPCRAGTVGGRSAPVDGSGLSGESAPPVLVHRAAACRV
ncbi:uncharacterized protein METZ01_LOCUS310604, partial [marine metagenome]